ncbi:MAG: 16S rRNA (guanine(527)-N(7))-methyltransferase RsmG [Candidatus Eremiobacteraeota bacterium]|nr:16S rRNA (guanine(527)-N(7))-methyltransferase RsmG [Candidatus Eremiobacteraeota bacterium]
MNASDVFAALGDAALEPAARDRVAAYGELLLDTNRRVNLTAARDPQAFAAHVRDALTLAALVRDPLVDVGSGGGFPAIVLAIATGVNVTLIESVRKKADFLARVLAELGIAGRVVAERAEIAGHDPHLRETFASATARAVASAPVCLELTFPLLRVGGIALLQRGAAEPGEQAAVEDAALVLGAGTTEVVTLAGNRRIVLATKQAPTQSRFPRRPGIPERRPLGGHGRG